MFHRKEDFNIGLEIQRKRLALEKKIEKQK